MSDDRVEAAARRERVPVRRYFAFWGIGVLVVGTALLLFSILSAVSTVIGLLLVAAFFAIALGPAVDWTERHLHVRRGLAVLAVFLVGFAVLSGLIYAFVRPIYDASDTFTRDLPRAIHQAEHGRGQVGRWLKDIGAQDWAKKNLPKIRQSLTDSNGLVTAGETIVTGVVAAITVLVLTFLLLLEGSRMTTFFVELFPDPRADHLRRVTSDAARSVTGYMAGNLLISLIAGTAIYLWLRALGIPFALVLALWVAFTDLLPLIGAFLGAVVVIFVALLTSPGAGIATLGFFIVYQLFENHVLQTTIMAKAVKLNPLGVLLAALAGVEIAGLLGALLAIPVAGAIQVVARDVWRDRRGVVEDVLSIGTDVGTTVREATDPPASDPPPAA